MFLNSIFNARVSERGQAILWFFLALFVIGIVFVALPLLGLGVETADTLSSALGN